MKKGELYIISAPSGAGKSSLIHEVLRRSSSSDSSIELSVSATTRPPRPNDVDGQDYFFMTKDKFEELEKKIDIEEPQKIDEFLGCFFRPFHELTKGFSR